MKTRFFTIGFGLLLGVANVDAGEEAHKDAQQRGPQRINLATALRLAGANNLDVKIARERLAEAEANELSAIEQFFPYLSPGVGFRRHEGQVQNVEGRILDVEKNVYTAGLGATAQVDLGEAIFRSLAARQLKQAATHAAGAQRQESVYQAAQAYFELARAQATGGIAAESVRISEDYAAQIKQAVDAGLAFKGDLYRALAQVERNRLAASQARERQLLAATRLAQILKLDATVELAPDSGELIPIRLHPAIGSLDSLVTEALMARPELKQFAAQLLAARKNRQGAIYGPLIPNISAQAFCGGLGGGTGNPGPNDFGQSSDYSAGVSWKIGPGGLFDSGRIRANEARVRSSALELEKLRDEVIRQVVDGYTRLHSLKDQIVILRRGLEAAEQSLTLARGRREFAVGEVLESIQAEQNVTRARFDYVTGVAEHNKAQYALERARGALAPAPAAPVARPTPKK